MAILGVNMLMCNSIIPGLRMLMCNSIIPGVSMLMCNFIPDTNNISESTMTGYY